MKLTQGSKYLVIVLPDLIIYNVHICILLYLHVYGKSQLCPRKGAVLLIHLKTIHKKGP